jgi:hypothetical protein
MHIEMPSITDIRLYESNTRQNDAAIGAVAESIKQCGLCQPIVFDAEGTIVCGHTREQRNRCAHRRHGTPRGLRYFQAGSGGGFRPRRPVFLHVQRGEKEVSKNGARPICTIRGVD